MKAKYSHGFSPFLPPSISLAGPKPAFLRGFFLLVSCLLGDVLSPAFYKSKKPKPKGGVKHDCRT